MAVFYNRIKGIRTAGFRYSPKVCTEDAVSPGPARVRGCFGWESKVKVQSKPVISTALCSSELLVCLFASAGSLGSSVRFNPECVCYAELGSRGRFQGLWQLRVISRAVCVSLGSSYSLLLSVSGESQWRLL